MKRQSGSRQKPVPNEPLAANPKSFNSVIGKTVSLKSGETTTGERFTGGNASEKTAWHLPDADKPRNRIRSRAILRDTNRVHPVRERDVPGDLHALAHAMATERKGFRDG
jgi:hypothetical protein